MMFTSTLVWGVAVVSAGFSSKTTTLAFIQNDNNYRLCAQMAVTEDRTRRIEGFGSPLVSSPFSPSSSASMLLANTDQAEEDNTDPDLFDYFDPLLSPHAYPSGVLPDKKPTFKSNDEIQKQQQQSSPQKVDGGSKGGFGIRLPIKEQNDEQNPSSSTKGADDQQQPQESYEDAFGIRLPGTEQNNEQKSSSSTKGDFGFKIRTNPTTSSPTMEEKDVEIEEDLFEYFDPLLSPHEYPDGIKPKKESISSVTAPPALEVVGNDKESSGNSGMANLNSNGKKKKVGVLLMDHGSKKEKSNARLEAMAKLYQMTLDTDEDEEDDGTPTIIVRAAHMEIALPSIPDALEELKDLGVDEIICHPFFLSADGRHVSQDIPEIIGNAIEELWGESTGATQIPIVTTAPVGSNTQLMLGAIHSLVRENSQYVKTTL